jgi:hypothetical protein
MTKIEKIGQITFSSYKRIFETPEGYGIREVLAYRKADGKLHSMWLCEEVYQSLSKRRIFKKGSEELLFLGYNEKEFSFLPENLDEVLQFLNDVVFSN